MKNKSIKNAFSLLEFSIYLFGFMLFVQMLSMFIVKSIQNSFLLDLNFSRLSAEQVMQATLYADGNQAFSSLRFWFIDEKNQCYIWRTAQHDIGWEIKKGDLVRSVGNYDYVQKKWQQRKKSRMLLGAHTLIITPINQKGHCHALTYHLDYNLRDSQKKKENAYVSSLQKNVQGRIELKNRIIG